MRILHTADWHLGKQFFSSSLIEDQAYALEQLHRAVRELTPDCVVIAGDIYDRAIPPVDAVQLLDETLRRLVSDSRIPIVIIAGNHDSPERLNFGSPFFASRGVRIVGVPEKQTAPLPLEDCSGRVDLYPVPYLDLPSARSVFGAADVHTHEQALRRAVAQCAVDPKRRNVLVCHAFVQGGAESESERPLSVGGTGAVSSALFDPFQYVALGHLHRPQIQRDGAINYAGSLLCYSFGEVDHEKSFTLAEIDAHGCVHLERISITPRRAVRTVSGRLAELLTAQRSEDYLAVELTDSGPVIDALVRLREVFPNVLHVARRMPETLSTVTAVTQREILRENESALFGRFLDVIGVQADEEQTRFFESALEELEERERSA